MHHRDPLDAVETISPISIWNQYKSHWLGALGILLTVTYAITLQPSFDFVLLSNFCHLVYSISAYALIGTILLELIILFCYFIRRQMNRMSFYKFPWFYFWISYNLVVLSLWIKHLGLFTLPLLPTING